MRFILLLLLISAFVSAEVYAQEPLVKEGETVYIDERGNRISEEAAQKYYLQTATVPINASTDTMNPNPGSIGGMTPQPEAVEVNAPFAPNVYPPEQPQATPAGISVSDSPGGPAKNISDSRQGMITNTALPTSVQSQKFVKLYYSALWTPSSGDNSLGYTQMDISSMFAFPCPVKESPLLITPGFSAWFTNLDRLGFTESKNLYGADLKIRWIKPLFSKYSLDIEAAPGYFSDFEAGSKNSLRFPAHIAGIWDYNPRTKIILGCAYLDRFDYNWLPFGGIIWSPDHLEMNFELLFPTPKIAKRIRWWGSAAGNDVSDWIYVAGEWGGNCWGIKGSGDTEMQIAYRDIRACLGFERKSVNGLNFAFEVGGLFNRKYRNSITNQDQDVDPNVFLRIKASY